MTEYLKLDSTRVSFGEYWRWKPGFPFLILAGSKLLRKRFPSTVLLPAVASVELVDPLAQPPELVAALAEPIKACEAKGYAVQFWYTVPTIGKIVALGAALVSRDGVSAAMAIAGQTRDGTNREVQLGLASQLLSGRFLTTGQGKSLFNPAPELEPLRLPGRSYAQLVDAHDSRVSSRRSEVMPCGDMQKLILELEQLQIRANVSRGVYVPASPEEVAELEAGSGAPTPLRQWAEHDAKEES